MHTPPTRTHPVNQVINTLELNNATVVAPASTSEQVLYINHTKVLVRYQYTPNTHIPVELFHEVKGNRWVRSWGLTSDADYLLYVDVTTGSHSWFHLQSLRELATKYLITDKVQMMNNTQATRDEYGVTANVMNVWISPSDDADYIHEGATHWTTEYAGFLAQCIGRVH